jgi:hypothetical protein
MMVGVVAAKHAGATTTALALASAGVDIGSPLLVEADPAGGDLAASTGLSLEPGLLTLAANGRHSLDASTVDSHCQHLNTDVSLLFAPMSRVQAVGALAEIGFRLAPVLAGLDRLVVVDAGRWEQAAPQRPLLMSSDITLVVVHPTVAGVEHFRARMSELLDVGCRVAIVTIGERPYRTEEVADATGTEVAGALAWDPRGANALPSAVGTRWLRRAPLVRSARTILDGLMPAPELAEVGR